MMSTFAWRTVPLFWLCHVAAPASGPWQMSHWKTAAPRASRWRRCAPAPPLYDWPYSLVTGAKGVSTRGGKPWHSLHEAVMRLCRWQSVQGVSLVSRCCEMPSGGRGTTTRAIVTGVPWPKE